MVAPLLLSVRVSIFAEADVWTSDVAHLVTDCRRYPQWVPSALAAVPQQPYQRYDFPIDAATMSVCY